MGAPWSVAARQRPGAPERGRSAPESRSRRTPDLSILEGNEPEEAGERQTASRRAPHPSPGRSRLGPDRGGLPGVVRRGHLRVRPPRRLRRLAPLPARSAPDPPAGRRLPPDRGIADGSVRGPVARRQLRRGLRPRPRDRDRHGAARQRGRDLRRPTPRTPGRPDRWWDRRVRPDRRRALRDPDPLRASPASDRRRRGAGDRLRGGRGRTPGRDRDAARSDEPVHPRRVARRRPAPAATEHHGRARCRDASGHRTGRARATARRCCSSRSRGPDGRWSPS